MAGAMTIGTFGGGTRRVAYQQAVAKLAAVRATRQVLDQRDGETRQLLAFDVSGRSARVAVAVGDVDRAGHVAVSFPGSRRPSNATSSAPTASRRTSWPSLAGPPAWWTTAVRSRSSAGWPTTSRRPPTRCAPATRWSCGPAPKPARHHWRPSFTALPPDRHLTLVGHSYGSRPPGSRSRAATPASTTSWSSAHPASAPTTVPTFGPARPRPRPRSRRRPGGRPRLVRARPQRAARCRPAQCRRRRSPRRRGREAVPGPQRLSGPRHHQSVERRGCRRRGADRASGSAAGQLVVGQRRDLRRGRRDSSNRWSSHPDTSDRASSRPITALAQREHLCVVGPDEALHRVRVVRHRRAYAGNRPRRHRDADPGAADEQCPVGLTGGDQLPGGHPDVAGSRCPRRTPTPTSTTESTRGSASRSARSASLYAYPAESLPTTIRQPTSLTVRTPRRGEHAGDGAHADPDDTAPGSGVPTDRAASGRARPTFGDSNAVASAPVTAAPTAVSHADARSRPAVVSRSRESVNGITASSRVLSPADALPRSNMDCRYARTASATLVGSGRRPFW